LANRVPILSGSCSPKTEVNPKPLGFATGNRRFVVGEFPCAGLIWPDKSTALRINLIIFANKVQPFLRTNPFRIRYTRIQPGKTGQGHTHAECANTIRRILGPSSLILGLLLLFARSSRYDGRAWTREYIWMYSSFLKE